MKNITCLLLLAFTLTSYAGTGGISSFLGFGNGGIDAGTGGIVGGVDDLDELKYKDWNTLRKYVKKNIDLSLFGDIAYVGRNVSVFDVCIDGDKIKTISKYPIYKSKKVNRSQDTDHDKDGWIRVLVDKKELSYPIEVERSERTCFGREDRNCRLVKKLFRQNTAKKIILRKDITRNSKRDKRKYKDIFTKVYDIPYCR